MAYISLRIVAAALISVAVLKTEAQQCTIPTSIHATWIDRLDGFRNTWTSTIDATGTTWKKVPPTLFSPRLNCESTSGTVATSFYFVTKVFNVKDCNEIKLRGNMLLMRYKAVPQGEQHTASNCSYIIPTNGEYLLRVKYPIDQAGVQCPFNDGSYQVTYSQSSSVKDQCSGDAESTAEVSGSQLNINSCYSGPAAYDKPYKVNFTCMGTVAGADIDSDANGKGLLLSYTANDGTTMFYCARYKTDGSAFNMSLNVFDWERWGCPIGADYNKFEDSSSSKFRAFTFTVPTTTVAPTTLSIKSTSAVDPATKAETTRSLTTDNTVKSTAEDTKKPLTTAATRSQSTPSSNVGVTTVQTTEGTLPATTTSTEGKHPCDNSPCQNAGLCLRITNTSYSCQCIDRFTGNNCETSLDQSPALSSMEINIIVIMASLLAAIIFLVVVVSLIVCHFKRKAKKTEQNDTNDYSAAGSKTWFPDYMKVN